MDRFRHQTRQFHTLPRLRVSDSQKDQSKIKTHIPGVRHKVGAQILIDSSGNEEAQSGSLCITKKESSRHDSTASRIIY